MPSQLPAVLLPIGIFVLVAAILFLAFGPTFRDLRRNRWLEEHGDPAEGHILSIRDTGIRIGGQAVVQADVQVHRLGMEAYTVRTRLRIPSLEGTLDLAVGGRVPLMVHPRDPALVAIVPALAPIGRQR